MLRPLFAALLWPLAAWTQAPPIPEPPPAPVYGPELEGFTYPFPPRRFEFTSQGVKLHMAFMEVLPERPNGRTVVLLHGKNFTGATWEPSMRVLAKAGYRVLAPDQVGFGALMFPEEVEQLVLVNPIGLEDWKAEGVPVPTVDPWYQRELQVTAERIRAYERATYYAGQWRPEFEPPVGMLVGLFQGPGRSLVAWNSALVYDMICTQPVVYEFGRLAAQRIPGARLVEFPGLGHAPQIQDPDAFHAALLEGLAHR